MADSLQNIFIIGLPGAGKTRTGKILAEALGWEFEDSDAVIEKEQGLKISEIFEIRGEKYFRQLEHFYLETFDKERVVVATGGGMPCFENNMETLKAKGLVVYLRCPLKVIFSRLDEPGFNARPMLFSDRENERFTLLKDLLKVRENTYQEADLIIDCQQNPEKFVKTIKQKLS